MTRNTHNLYDLFIGRAERTYLHVALREGKDIAPMVRTVFGSAARLRRARTGVSDRKVIQRGEIRSLGHSAAMR